MAEQNAACEQTYAETVFGTVTSRRVIYRRARSWRSGGFREDIPLRQVTSVRLDISRSVSLGVLLLLAGSWLLLTESALRLVGIAVLGLAALVFWGSPAVVVNAAGRDLNAAKGYPWERADAVTFTEALRGQLFRDRPR